MFSALTVSVRFGRPEIAILSPGTEELDFRDQILLCRTEFLLDYSRHPGHEERLVCSLSNFHIIAISKKRRAEKMVLYNILNVINSFKYFINAIYFFELCRFYILVI